MARKSRKNIEEKNQISNELKALSQAKISLGGYVRLSRDLNNTDSIETQVLMIKQYVADHPEFELYDIYSDDGHTGTSFDRPDFNRLIQDAQRGVIQGIIVKDLSRFGRNYIEAGYYMETVLPRLQVRLISINDRFDSARPEDQNGIEIPLKNMINAMFAIDTSKKIVRGFELKSSTGETKYRTTTYGYFIDSTGKSLVVDPVASRYVKLIYLMYLNGYACKHIADRLNFMGVMIPGKYKEQFTNRKSTSKTEQWIGTSVCAILKNNTYVGDKVNGKQRTRLETKENHTLIPREEWIIHKDYHEPIVGRKDFETALEQLNNQHNEILKNRAELAEERNLYKNAFGRKIICSCCGTGMYYVRRTKGSSRLGISEAKYVCRNCVDENHQTTKSIPEDYLKIVVVDQIKAFIQYVVASKGLAGKMKSGDAEYSVITSLEKKYAYWKRKERDVGENYTELYKNLVDEIIDEDEYKLISKKYSEQKKEIEQTISQIGKELYQKKQWIIQFENLCENFSSLSASDIDTDKLIAELVKTIYYDADGSIRIVFSCEDVIARFNSLLEGESNGSDCNVSSPVAV